MFFSCRRIHPFVVFALTIFTGYLALFLLAAFPGHEHDHQCDFCAWFSNLSIGLPAVLALQIWFLYFRQGFSSFRSPRSSLLLPEGRAPPVS